MTKKSIPLKEIVDGMNLVSDEITAYLNRLIGEVVTVTDEEWHMAEENEPMDDLQDWQKENVRKAREVITEEENFIPLPTKFEIHEWRILEQFALSREDEEMSEELSDAIRGKGAFRIFKSAIRRLGIEDQWYEFREEAFREIARTWCRENGVVFTE